MGASPITRDRMARRRSNAGACDPGQILDLAAEIADTDGLAAVNTERLAERLRIRPASLDRHFANIDMIKDALAIRALGELIALYREVAQGRTGRDALYAIAHNERTYAQARPGHYLAAVQDSQRRAAAIGAQRQTCLSMVALTLETYQMNGAAAIEVARCVMAAVQGFIVLELSGGIGTPYETDQTYQRLLELLDASARSAARSLIHRHVNWDPVDSSSRSEPTDQHP